jgi:hypothetical protein
MARPAEAPQPEPDTGFFMRNALQMQDPNGQANSLTQLARKASGAPTSSRR